MSWKKYGIEKKDLLIPSSILIGAILVSGSIWMNSGNLPERGGSAVAAQNEEAQPGAEENVKVAARKDAPAIGTGKLEIIEFSDFQCPFCQRFYTDSFAQIKTKYIDTGKAKLVFRHYPLPFHQNAQKAAEAAECASRQGKFSQYHDELFTKGQSDGTGLNVSDLKQYAANLGLNTEKFNSCLDKGEAAEAVKKDMEDAQKVGVNGTPTIIIDGKKIVGALPFATFEAAIEEALK